MADPLPAQARNEVLWFLDATFSAWNWAHKSMRDAVKNLTVPEAARQPGISGGRSPVSLGCTTICAGRCSTSSRRPSRA